LNHPGRVSKPGAHKAKTYYCPHNHSNSWSDPHGNGILDAGNAIYVWFTRLGTNEGNRLTREEEEGLVQAEGSHSWRSAYTRKT